jgi:hypothetical protein
MQAPMASTVAATDDRRTDRMMLDMALAKLQYLSSEMADLRIAVTALQGARCGGVAAGVARSVFFDADEVGPFERGFYEREFDGNGRPFRWTGQGEFVEFRFFIDRNAACRFVINAHLYGGADLGPVRAFVDYTAVPIEIAYRGDAATLSGEIPPCPFATRATLTLWSPARWVPAAGDERTLWFAFYDLAAGPVAEPAAAAADGQADEPGAVAHPDSGDADAAAGGAEEAAEEQPDLVELAAPKIGEGEGSASAASSSRAHRTRREAAASAESQSLSTASDSPVLAEADAEAGHAAPAPSRRRSTWKH